MKLSPEILEDFQAKGKFIFCYYEKEKENKVNGIIIPGQDDHHIKQGIVLSVGSFVESVYRVEETIMFESYRAIEIFSNETKAWVVIPEEAVFGGFGEN